MASEDGEPQRPDKKDKALPPALQLDWEDLPTLTDSEMIFFEQIMSGTAPVEAYKAAYPNSEGWAPGKLWKQANRLRRDIRIETCVAAAQTNSAGGSELPKAAHLRELERLRERALDAGNYGAAVKAEELRGKVAGHYVERREDVTPIDPVNVLKRMARFKGGEQLAHAMAEQNGIPWERISDKPAPTAPAIPLQAIPPPKEEEPTEP